MDNSSNHASALHARLILSQGKRRAVEAKSVCRRVASSAHSILARVVGSVSSLAPVPPLEHLLFPQQQQQQVLWLQSDKRVFMNDPFFSLAFGWLYRVSAFPQDTACGGVVESVANVFVMMNFSNKSSPNQWHCSFVICAGRLRTGWRCNLGHRVKCGNSRVDLHATAR